METKIVVLLFLTFCPAIYPQSPNSKADSSVTVPSRRSSTRGLCVYKRHQALVRKRRFRRTLGVGPCRAGGVAQLFSPYFLALAISHRVIYYDAFGSGKSDRASGEQKYTFTGDVENLEGLRKALGLGKIILLGHSYGGMVAQAYVFFDFQNPFKN